MTKITNGQVLENRGFTLSELLISLAVIGLIAVLTIPTLLRSVSQQQDRARLKETIAATQQVLYQAQRTGRLTALPSQSEVIALLRSDLNYTKECSNGTADCTSSTTPHDYPTIRVGATSWILASGASITSLGCAATNPSHQSCDFTFDANGPQAPNLPGQDEVTLSYCLTAGLCDNTASGQQFKIIKTCLPCASLWQQNHQLYDSLWR